MITLMRNNSIDDIVSVRKRHQHVGFVLSYKQFNRTWVQKKTLDEVLDYIGRMFRLLQINNGDILQLHVDIPGYPSYAISLCSLTDDVIDDIMEMISEHLSNPARSFR